MTKYTWKSAKSSNKQFTNAEDMKNLFWAKAENRREMGDNAHGDAGYWNGGRCNWGGSHNLQEDCENLAQFFNATVSVADDVAEIKLSANEQIFNQKKQALITKIQDCINKCQASESYSIASVCCIWNDYFGIFLKPFLNTFSKRLQNQLKEVKKLEPKHQKELLQLETEAKKAENDYKENKAKADQETNPDKKAEFMLLANKAARKAEDIKRKVKVNPLADLSRFSNLDDLEILKKGNIPKESPSNPRNPRNTNPSNGGENSSSNNSQQLFNQQQVFFFAGAALLVVFYLYTQNQEEPNHYDYY